MSFDRHFVRKLHQFARENLQQLGSGLGRLGIAGLKEQAALGFDQIDSQTLGGQGDSDLFLHVFKCRNLLQACSSFSLRCCSSSRFSVSVSPTPALVVPVWRPLPGGIQEISADGLLHFFAGAQQPQNNEQRHHRRDEVRVRDFPGSAVPVIVIPGVLPHDDDRRFGFLALKPPPPSPGSPDFAANLIHLLKRRPQMMRDGAPRGFQREHRRKPLHIRQQAHAKTQKVFAFRIRVLLDMRRHRPQEPVTQQDAEKCSHQGGGHLMPDFFRRPAQGPHRDHDAQEPRRQSPTPEDCRPPW